MNCIFSKIVSILSRPALRRRGWIVFSITALSFITVSCLENAGVEYSTFVQTGEAGIPEGWEYEFSPVPADSASIGSVPYDLILVVRYGSSCKLKELPLNLEEFSLSHEKPDSLKVNIGLFDNNDEPIGRGNYSIYETSDTLRRGVIIPEGYTISVSSPLRDNETEGIHAIGIILSRTGSSQKLNMFNL